MRPIKQQSLLTLDSPSNDPYRVWYFGFCENIDELSFMRKLLTRNHPKHLRHTYAFTQVGDFVLFVEPENDRIDFVVKYPQYPGEVLDAEAMADELVKQDHVVVRHVYIPSIRGIKSIWNWVPSCVSVVKCATGYSSFAITPKKLLHNLIKDGAYVYLNLEKTDESGKTKEKQGA